MKENATAAIQAHHSLGLRCMYLYRLQSVEEKSLIVTSTEKKICTHKALITHQISLGSVVGDCLHLLQNGSWLQGHINSDYGLSTLHQILTLAEILPRCETRGLKQPT